MKGLRKTFQFLFYSLSFFSLIILLLSSFSDWVSPFRSVWFAYLGMFFPFILGFNVFIFLLSLIFKQWKLSAANLVVFIICSGSIFTYFPINFKTKNVPEDCIKLLTYNVMRFEHLGNHTSKNPNPIIEYIVDSDADIICLQEFGVSTRDNTKLTMEKVKKALKKTPYSHIQETPASNGLFYGLAIFSKYPISNIRKVPYESPYNTSYLVDLDIDGRKVTFVNNHLESNKLTKEERVGFSDLTKEPNITELKSFTQAIFHRLTPAFRERAFQAQLVRAAIDETTNPYILVCGDFNDTPISYSRHKIKGDLNDAFAESGTGMGITYNMYNFLFRIDYILYSKNIKSYNTTVGKLRNSDHYPVTTYLQFLE